MDETTRKSQQAWVAYGEYTTDKLIEKACLIFETL